MPVTAAILRVVVRWTAFGEPCENVGYFYPVGAAFLTATCTQVAEAVWNDFKADYRALLPATPTEYLFKEVFVEEVDVGAGIGTYPIPAAEQPGTRATTGGVTVQQVWNSASVKLVVGSHATRPGGKRWSPIYDQDVDGDRVLGATILGLMDAFGALWGTTRTLGAPVATGTLVPQVVSLITPLTYGGNQEVIGYQVNPKGTHQTTRGN
jgi:hypothetical protein